MSFPKQGQWVRWITDAFGREGQVIESEYPSITVKWLGVEEPQVFPIADMYFTHEQSALSMELIQKPKKMPQDRQQGDQHMMSVRDAAIALETTPKALRIKLRAGKIKGLKKDGKWVGVYL